MTTDTLCYIVFMLAHVHMQTTEDESSGHVDHQAAPPPDRAGKGEESNGQEVGVAHVDDSLDT